MNDVFILGAGFSKAIHSRMPTMDEISTEILKRLERAGLPTYDLNQLGNNIELWMTYLCQPQPWLKSYENDQNRAKAGFIRQQIRDIVEVRTSEVAMSGFSRLAGQTCKGMAQKSPYSNYLKLRHFDREGSKRVKN